MRALRLALAQSCPSPHDIEANAHAAAAIIAAAAEQGAQLVAFPELFLTGYDLPFLAEAPGAWLEEGDARLDPVRQACAEKGVTAILGAALRTRTGEPRIAAPVVGPQGDVGISYKEHVHRSEAALFRAGLPLPPFEVHGWRVAVAICFDAARPDHAQQAALAGADLYLGSALYERGEERRSDLHFGARAMDNRIFSALANYAETTGGHPSCGLSGVWGPSGEVIARMNETRDALLVVDLDPGELERYRGR